MVPPPNGGKGLPLARIAGRPGWPGVPIRSVFPTGRADDRRSRGPAQGVPDVNDRPTLARKRVPTIKRLPALVLVVLALGAITAGCVKDHDPRDDSSRIDTHSREIPALAQDHVTA